MTCTKQAIFDIRLTMIMWGARNTPTISVASISYNPYPHKSNESPEKKAANNN